MKPLDGFNYSHFFQLIYQIFIIIMVIGDIFSIGTSANEDKVLQYPMWRSRRFKLSAVEG